MTINDRVKSVRLSLKMNQTQFGEIFGITQSGVSAIEKNIRNVSERNIRILCDRLCVNEEYLRDGKEPMFLPDSSFSLDEYIKEHGLSRFGRDFVKCIVEMPKDIQEPLMNYLQGYFANNGNYGK